MDTLNISDFPMTFILKSDGKSIKRRAAKRVVDSQRYIATGIFGFAMGKEIGITI